jgi:hypothetical protein
MTTPRKNAAKTRGKPFEPGNPGRPKGARHRVTLAIEALLDGQYEALTAKAIEKALEGDMVALRLCLDRIAPPRRDAPITLSLPKVRTAGDVLEASAAVLAAVAAGEVTPDEAGRLMALLVAHRGIVETADLDRRLAALESLQPARRIGNRP